MIPRQILRTKFYNERQHGDIRDALFAGLGTTRFKAEITVCGSGVLSGVAKAAAEAEELGLSAFFLLNDGADVAWGEVVAELEGTAKQIAMAEELMVGCMSKTSGIAYAARTAVNNAAQRVEIVCGAWKKMPPSIKTPVREAIGHGGASFRIISKPMLYIDKNYLRMFGGIPQALEEARQFPDLTPVVQLRKEAGSIATQTTQALEGGGGVLMIDTGDVADIAPCLETLKASGRRADCLVAYSGGVKLRDIDGLAASGIDIMCIGQAIVDAPLMDMRLDVRLDMRGGF